MTITAALLKSVQQSGEDALVLVEGLEAGEFCRSRLTRQAVCRLLAAMADALQALPQDTAQQMPEIDWPGWRALAPALVSPSPAGDEAAWAATQVLVPTTLSWLRVYQQAAPALFGMRP